MASWRSARIEDIDEISDGRSPWRPVRHHFGIEAFGVNAFTGKQAGDRLINEHDEADDGQQELYLVHAGRARFEIGGETLDAPAGTLVFVEPGQKRTAFAEEPGTTLLAVGSVAGRGYRIHGWDIWGPIQPLYQAGEYAEAAERLDAALADDPPFWGVHYNAACIYSLSGRPADAVTHLRRAHELAGDEADVREMAKADTDLDAIRGEAGYRELVGDG
ncbi:MAG TPA: tetratricopeptide repeat protein [Gaiellaceae bacterium]